MSRSIASGAGLSTVTARALIAISNDVPSLVIEVDASPAMIEELWFLTSWRCSGERSDNLSLTLRAEEHLEVVGV